MADSLPHVPTTYTPVHGDAFTLHVSPDEDPLHVKCLTQAVAATRTQVVKVLRWEPQRHLHVCCYATLSEARRSLDRHVPPTMAMAPFCDEVSSLIVIQSPQCDASNGDPARLSRLLAHELTHAFAAEKTRSFKRLGDGQQAMRLSSWLNEGLAEVISLLVTGQPNRIRRAEEAFRSSPEIPTFGALSQRLDSLEDSSRGDAFATVTGAVGLLCSAITPAGLFRQLTAVDRACPADAPCSADHLNQVLADAVQSHARRREG